jgi:hypothetical protein
MYRGSGRRKTRVRVAITVSLGIEPGYIVFSSKK